MRCFPRRYVCLSIRLVLPSVVADYHGELQMAVRLDVSGLVLLQYLWYHGGRIEKIRSLTLLLSRQLMEHEKATQQLLVPSCKLAAWSIYGTVTSSHQQPQQAERLQFAAIMHVLLALSHMCWVLNDARGVKSLWNELRSCTYFYSGAAVDVHRYTRRGEKKKNHVDMLEPECATHHLLQAWK